jgi:hypothetical protein
LGCFYLAFLLDMFDFFKLRLVFNASASTVLPGRDSLVRMLGEALVGAVQLKAGSGASKSGPVKDALVAG